MRKNIICLLITFFFAFSLNDLQAQDPPPNDANATIPSGVAGAANKMASVPINYYTGIPTISIPLFSYSQQNGLNMNIALTYSGAGGVKVNELPSSAGLGWFLNAGGVISRTVRGMPDDIPTNGFMYSAAIPSDFRANGTKYYHDSLDAEQDVFQYDVNGLSGKFYIGKNKQIVAVPLSKLRIGYTTTGGNNTPINSFYIITENGTKYVFNDTETQSINNAEFKCGYNLTNYTSAWYLSQVVAPLGTDTIKLFYNTMSEGGTTVSAPQTVYIRNSDNFQYRRFTPLISQSITTKKISSIVFQIKRKCSFCTAGLLSTME